MDQEKIGKFIKQLRENKKLTQEELGNMLNVSGKSVSKWERGIHLPDISNMQILTDIFDISINELLSGEKNPSIEKSNKNYINFLKISAYKEKVKYIKYLVFIVLFFCTLLGFLFIYNDYGKNTIYTLNSLNDNYAIKGFFVTNQGIDLFSLNNIIYQGNDENELMKNKINEANITFLYKDNIINTSKYINSNNLGTKEFIDSINFFDLDNIEGKTSKFKIDNKNIDFKIVFEIDINNKIIEEQIPLKIERMFINNKIVY